MFIINQRELRKGFGFVANMNKTPDTETEIKVYSEDDYFVAMLQDEDSFIKLRVPIVKKDTDLSFKMNGKQFMDFLKKFPAKNVRKLDLYLKDNMLNVDVYKTPKDKPEEYESTFSFYCTPIRKPRRSSIKYTFSNELDYDNFLEFVKLSESMSVKNGLYTFYDYGKLRIENDKIALYYADATTFYKMCVDTEKEVNNDSETEEKEIHDVLFRMSDITKYKKLIKGNVDTTVKIGVSTKGILLSSKSVEFLLPIIEANYPKVEVIFEKDKETIFEIKDASMIEEMKRNCKKQLDYDNGDFKLKAEYCHKDDVHRNEIILSKDENELRLEICEQKYFLHRHRETAYCTVGYELYKVDKIVGMFWEPEMFLTKINDIIFMYIKDKNKEVLVLPRLVNAD